MIAYHLLWTGYGWWLPNDPRGSTSTTVRNDLLKNLGELHHGRKSLQPASRDIHRFYEDAHSRLKHAPFELCKLDIVQCVAGALKSCIEPHRYTCYACVIMPDHVHILIRRHKHSAEEMIQNLQFTSRDALHHAGLVPDSHPVWSAGGWKTFLDHPNDVRRTIRYIDNNPIKGRRPEQQWSFVTSYDDWPLHQGHSKFSPYVKALRAAGQYP